MQESNSFAPTLAETSDFEIQTDRALVEFFDDTNSELAGFLDGCKAERWSPIPLIAANAISGGPLSKSCFEDISTKLLAAIPAEKVDGLLLSLHGAMTTEHYPSGDAELVRRVRSVVGQTVPVVVSHDLHANVAHELLTHVDGLVGYRTYPHVDQRETGRRASTMLARVLAGQKYRRWRLPIPLLLPPQAASTFQKPLRTVMDLLATEFRETDGEFAFLFCVQPWLDFTPVASCLTVTQFGSAESVPARMRTLAERLWSIRKEFGVDWVAPENLVERIQAAAAPPVLVSEATDAPTGGGSGDHTGLLRCLLPAAATLKSCIYLVDAPFAERASAAGMGREVEGVIGSSIDGRYSEPVHIRALVDHLSDGGFTAKGPAFHGRRFSMGATAVLRIGELRIVVASKPVMMIDPELYRSQGIEPSNQDVVGIKSPLLFRAAYEPIGGTVIHLDLPGPCRGRLEKVDFRYINRPIYPVDDFEWTPPQPELA
jgi:microcystin degradation protein MlrC